MTWQGHNVEPLQITADWMGIKESGGSISVVKDFGTDDNSAGLELLSKARDRRDINRKTLLETFRIHGILSDDFDADKDLAEIANEPPSIFGGSESNIDAGQ